ncbi:MAG: hypothetical protein AAB774_00550 [Patescibacteria group bacterium]
MHLQRNRIYRKQVYKTGSIFSVGPTTARYLVLLLLGVFSLLFLVQSTQGAQTSVELNKQETLNQDQQQELTTLEVQSSRLKSLQNLNQAALTQGLVPIGNPEPIVTVTAE